MKQIGYRPFHATKRLNNGPTDEEEENLEETLRFFIREEIRGVVFFGIKKSSIDDVKKLFPKFFDYLAKNYADHIPSCKVAFRQSDRVQTPTPYVLLPNEKMTVVSWDKARSCPVYSSSEDLARYIEKLK